MNKLTVEEEFHFYMKSGLSPKSLMSWFKKLSKEDREVVAGLLVNHINELRKRIDDIESAFQNIGESIGKGAI